MEIDKEKFEQKLEILTLSDLVSLPVESKVNDVLKLMQNKRIGSVPITENKKLVGIITERDLLLKALGKIDHWQDAPVDKIMTANPFSVTNETKISKCIQLISKQELRHLPVLNDQGEPVRMASINDILKFIVDFFPKQVEAHGTLTNWNSITITSLEEDFSFTHGSGPGKVSGNIFLYPLKKAVHRDVLKADVNSDVWEILELLQSKRRGACLLTEFETTLEGIITERDFLFKVMNKQRFGDKAPISQFMTPKPHTLLSTHYIAYAINNMFKFNYRNTIIVDEDRIPLSIISLMDIFKYLGDYLSIDETNDKTGI